MSGSSSDLEEGSDAWLLLHILTADDQQTYCMLIDRFEHSGRILGDKLDSRLNHLHEYIDTLIAECQDILQDSPKLLNEVIKRLHQVHTQSSLALIRGYQYTRDQQALDTQNMTERLEHRLTALQRVNRVSNSAMDLDQTLELTAQVVAEELHVELCSIFFYDEAQRVLTLKATNGPRPLGGMHFTLRLGEGYSGWVADKGRPLLVNDALSNRNFATEARTYSADYHGLMAVPIIFFGDVARLIGVVSVQSAEL